MKLLPWLLLVAVTGAFATWVIREQNKPVARPVRRLEVSIPRGFQLAPNAPLAVAPDGSAIVFGLLDQRMQTKLWLRSLDKFDLQPIAGTDGASFPFWSPDSKSIAFFVESATALRRLDLASGIVQLLCRTDGSARGGSWGPDGTILFTPDTNDAIKRVSASGGTPADVTRLDPAIIDGSHRFPVFLPDGQRFLFTLWSNHTETASRVGGIYAGSLKGGEIRKLSSDSSQAVLAGNNRLLIYRNRALQSVSFNPDTLEITGGVEEITQHPLFLPASGALTASASNAGDIAYANSSGEGTAQLAWVDAGTGTQRIIGTERLGIQNLVVAPDGTRFAAQIVSGNGADIWVMDSTRMVMTRLTRGGLDATGPVWSPDGLTVAFTSQASGSLSIYTQPADASKPPELFFTQKDRDFRVSSWSADGRFMLMESSAKGGGAQTEIWSLDVASKKTKLILSDREWSVGGPVLSPDGRWLAYVSNESGGDQLYLRSYPALDRKWQISEAGVLKQSNFFALAATTYLSHWRKDGRELLFITLDGSVAAADIKTDDGNLTAAAARVVFKPTFPLLTIAPAPNHDRFLTAIVPGDVTSEPIRVVLTH